MEDISSKVDVVYDHVVEAEADDYYVGNEAVSEEHNGESLLMGSGTMQFRALRRTLKKSNRYLFLTLFHKKSHFTVLVIFMIMVRVSFNRRISDLLNSESRRLSNALESVTEESDRRFSDLFNLTTEMFEDQVYYKFVLDHTNLREAK